MCLPAVQEEPYNEYFFSAEPLLDASHFVHIQQQDFYCSYMG